MVENVRLVQGSGWGSYLQPVRHSPQGFIYG